MRFASSRELLAFLVDDLIGTAGDLQVIVVLLDEGVDMTHALLLEDFFYCNKDTRLLDIAETVVDSRAEEFHGGRKAHVGINQRGNVIAEFANFAIQDLIIFLEGMTCEELFKFSWIGIHFLGTLVRSLRWRDS